MDDPAIDVGQTDVAAKVEDVSAGAVEGLNKRGKMVTRINSGFRTTNEAKLD